jgi:hypothetical protein
LYAFCTDAIVTNATVVQAAGVNTTTRLLYSRFETAVGAPTLMAAGLATPKPTARRNPTGDWPTAIGGVRVRAAKLSSSAPLARPHAQREGQGNRGADTEPVPVR